MSEQEASINRCRLVEEVLEAQQQLLRKEHDAAMANWLHLELTMGQMKALFALDQSGPVPVGRLAAALGIGKPGASMLVDRLVQLGLVERTEDPLDRRRTLTSLSPRGRDLVAGLRQGRRERVEAWLRQLDDAELASLARGLRALVRVASVEPVLEGALT